MVRSYTPFVSAFLLGAAACATATTEPEPEPELTDRYAYEIELWVDAWDERGDSVLFDQLLEDESETTPLANTILVESPDGAGGTASVSTEPLEITASATVWTGDHEELYIDTAGSAEWDLERCGYPEGTELRIVATLGAAVPAAAFGDFAGADGRADFDIWVSVRVRTRSTEWQTSGEARADLRDATGYVLTWEQPAPGDPADPEDFFQDFDGGSATRTSPPIQIGSDGCLDIDATLETEADATTVGVGDLRVSGSYSLSVQIET